MIEQIENLRERIMAEPEVYDPPTQHHELNDGGHAQKLALKNIDGDSQLYADLIALNAEFLRSIYDGDMPQVLIGMANSAIRIAHDTAMELGDDVVSTETAKDKKGRVVLPYASNLMIRQCEPEFVLLVEDVATTGKSTAHFARRFGYRFPNMRLEVANIWQRQPRLPYLERNHIPHYSMINYHLQVYRDEAVCRQDPDGYCARGIPLVPRGS